MARGKQYFIKLCTNEIALSIRVSARSTGGDGGCETAPFR